MTETLPCGCKIDTVGEAFVMVPCSLECRYYLYAMDEAGRQQKPVYEIVDPEL